MKTAILLTALYYIKYANAATGIATYYGGNENGNACGFNGVNKNKFPFGYYAAIGGKNFDSGYGCGKCYKITCLGPDGNNPKCKCSNNPTVTVQSLDHCPECSNKHFDLNPTSMAKIVGPGLSGTCGKIKIKYERVNCQMSGGFKVRNKGGTSKYWYGLHVENVNGAGGVKKVELYKNNNKIGTCNKNQGPSFFICSKIGGGAFPNPPLSIKIFSDSGTSKKANNCIKSYDGGKTFQCSGNLPRGSLNGAFTEESEATDAVSWTAIFAIICCVILCIVCIGFGGYYYMKKRKQQQAVSFDKAAGDTPINDENEGPAGTKTGGYDMSPINTIATHENNDDVDNDDDDEEKEEEIEINVEVEVEEQATPAGDD